MSTGPLEMAVPRPALGQLLDAKFSPPRLRPGSVSRAQLAWAARASDCRVVTITAPPGYGKSTFMAEWAEAEDRRVAWVSLDRFDDDPAILLASLASAFERADPESAELVADINGRGVSALGRAAPRLAAALRASPVRFVFMLDDLHEVSSPACHDVLGVVISGIPHGSQLVTASRSEHPLLPRLRALGEALEFESRDLALDAAGAQQIFANVIPAGGGEHPASCVGRARPGYQGAAHPGRRYEPIATMAAERLPVQLATRALAYSPATRVRRPGGTSPPETPERFIQSPPHEGG